MGKVSHGSVLNENYAPTRVTSGWKSTIVMLNGASNTVSVDGTVSTNGVLSDMGPGSVSASAMGAVNYGAINLGLQGNGTILLTGAAPMSNR